jgi:preprotein translocase subunit SecB
MSEEQGKNEVSINMQYIKDMSLEVPHAPEIFAKITTPPQIGVDLNIDAQKLNDDQFEVTLNMRINAKVAEEPLFIFELSYAAACTVKIPDENKEPVLYIEIPRMLFPYARQIISSNLAEAGLPPLMLTPVDFAAVYKAKKEQQAASKVAN